MLQALRRQGLHEHGEPKLVGKTFTGAKPLDQLGLEVDDVGMGVSGRGDEEGVLVSVLDYVPEPDEEFDVGADWVIVRKLVPQAPLKIPGLWVTLDADVPALAVEIVDIQLPAQAVGVK